jgi:hypothetical protein
MFRKRIHTLLTVAYFTGLLVANSTELLAQDLKGDELIAKHVESIGTKEKRDAIRNRMGLGSSSFESKLPAKSAVGKAVIASDDGNLMFLTSFSSQEYPFEKIGNFNGKISLPWVTAGRRSPLGAFLADHEKILTDGLLAGTISELWALLDLEGKRATIKAGGTKKIDGKKLYVLEYYPKSLGSAEFTIRLFFDSETFRHVRSEYRDQISPSQDRFGQLGRQSGVKIHLIETFDDFKTVEGLTLPHLYRLEYRTESNSGVYEFIWSVKIQEYRFNNNLAPDFFSFDTR